MADQTPEDTALGRGTRRKKIAGYLKAANELRQSYTQAYLGSGARGDSELDEHELGIPGAFPTLKVSRNGSEEMVLFPSYARRHSPKSKPPQDYPIPSDMKDVNGAGDAEYWRKEWEFYEDKNAVVDVDVRGWIYSPQQGPMNRKNRLLLGIARHLSGIPAPASSAPETTRHEDHVAARQAQALSQHAANEAEIAGRGGYSDIPNLMDSPNSSRSASPKPGQIPHPVTDTSLQEAPIGAGNLSKRSSWGPSEMSVEELSSANARLLRRLKPFFTTPAVGMSLTIFYYNEHTSQSRTTRTNDSGHFNFRAALDFIPTNVRVLASENLSATSEIVITEPRGISLVSDIDDTIKHSAIGNGAKEIFRNAFVRDLSELTIEGVRSWYHKMADMGVKLHYLSNSPWQMYPLLVTYFAQAQLPPGSFHLKQYSGMLQGIFEPVAERKKGTLDRIMNDFPDRRFILVGDSGEADLELYTETALRDPKRIIAIFIRDVTTPPNQPFFDSAAQTPAATKRLSPLAPKSRTSSNSSLRPALPARAISEFPVHTAEPEEDLIAFSDDELASKAPRKLAERSAKPRPPPPPSKPLALRSNSGSKPSTKPAPPAPPWKLNSNQASHEQRKSITAYHDMPIYDDTEERMKNRYQEAGIDEAPPLPPRRGLSAYPIAAAQYASSRLWADGSNSRSSSPGPVNKREELWKRRLARAKEALEGKGVVLKTWRVGSDIEREAMRLVEKCS